MKLGAMHIDLPAEWEDRSLYTFIAPAQKAAVGMVVTGGVQFRTNVVIAPSPLPQGEDLESAVVRAKERIVRDFGKVEMTVIDGPLAGGQKTRRIRYRVVNQRGGTTIEQHQYVIIANQREWTVTFSTLAMEAKALEPKFDEYVRSIKFEDK